MIEIPDTIETFGQVVRYLRRLRDLSLRELARRAGISVPFLSDLERDRRSTDRITQLARALEIEDEVLQRFDNRVPRELIEWLKSRPDVKRLLLERMRSEDD